MKPVEERKMFVPARALEHDKNPENYTLKRKICMAVARLIITGNFFEHPEDNCLPIVVLQNHSLNPIDLGYDVKVLIRR